MLVLCGDLGGTKTLLQVAEFKQGNYRVLFQERFISSDFNSLIPMLDVFLNKYQKDYSSMISSACFAVAGPVKENSAHITNLDWQIETKSIAKQFNIKRIKLVNDFYAVASAIDILNNDDLLTLQNGNRPQLANRAIIGAGTGLGTAMQIWTGEKHHVVSTEAGHISFAPGDKIQLELLDYLMREQHQVSYENILSGNGLKKIYQFLLHKTNSDDYLHNLMLNDDAAAIISEYGLSGKDSIAAQTLDIFVNIYGRQAGNLALSCLAYGGVYIAGGIAAKNIDKFEDGQFINAFNNNRQMGHLLNNMPVYVITNLNVGLIGAAYIASQLK